MYPQILENSMGTNLQRYEDRKTNKQKNLRKKYILPRRIKEKSIFAAFQIMIIKHHISWDTEIPVTMTGLVFVV